MIRTSYARSGSASSPALNFLVSEAANGLEALVRCEAELPNIIIVDAGLDGALELIANIRTLPEGKTVRIYYCVVEADLKKMMAGKRAGADDFLLKPFDRKILTSVFGRPVSRRLIVDPIIQFGFR